MKKNKSENEDRLHCPSEQKVFCVLTALLHHHHYEGHKKVITIDILDFANF